MLRLDYLTDRQYILNLLTGLLLFICYFLLSAPSVTFEDSGTLITAVSSLGVSHQPGYPLWTEITRILSGIMHGDIASSINRTSGLLFAIAFLVFAFILDEYNVKPVYKVLFTILAGLLPAFLSQAVIAEVYGFNLLLMTSCWYSAIKSRQETRWLYLFAYITGISISHHYALLPMFIPLIYFIYRKFISSKQKLMILLSFIFMIIGSSTYILLLFHFRNKASFDIIQIKSISGILKYYFMFSYSNESQPFIQKFLSLSLYFLKKNIFALPYYLLMFLGLTGMVLRIYKLIKDKELFELSFWVAFSIASYLGMAYSLNSYNYEGSEVYLHPFFLLVIFSVASLFSIKISSKIIINKSIILITLLYTLIISSISIFTNNLSNYKYPFDFGKDYLRSSVYRGQIILTREGSKGLFVLPYISDIKDFRPDIDFKESLGLFKIRQDQEYLPAAYYYVHFNLDTYMRNNNKEEPLIALQPMGLLLVAAPHSQSDLNIFLPWLYIKMPEKTSNQHDYDPYIKQRYLFFRGLAYLYADNLKKAESDFEQVNKIGNSNDFIFSTGLAFFKKKHFNKSLSYFEKAAKMQGNNPLIWKYLTLNYAMLKKFDKAQEALKMSEKLEKRK